MSEKPLEWEITIDRFDGFVPSWFSNDWPTVGVGKQNPATEATIM